MKFHFKIIYLDIFISFLKKNNNSITKNNYVYNNNPFVKL